MSRAATIPERFAAGARASLPRLDARDAWILAALLVAFVASRLAWLESAIETTVYWEESYRWIAAREILAGSPESLLDWQADHYQGGPLLTVLGVALLFGLFGDGVFVMKLVPLIFSTATLALLYAVGRKGFGRPVGTVAALAYLTGPPLVAFWGLSAMGSHGESSLFSLAQVLIFFRLTAEGGRTTATWAALGLIAGLGLWFCSTSGLALAACGLVWLLMEGWPRMRELGAALAGAALGLLPWLAYNLRYSFAGVGRILELLGFGDPIDPWLPHGPLEKLVALVLYDLPVGLMFPWDSLSLTLQTWVWMGAALLPVVFGVGLAAVRAGDTLRERFLASPSRDERELAMGRRELVFLAYLGIWLAVMVGSRFVPDPSDGVVAFRFEGPLAVMMMTPFARSVALGLARPSVAPFVAVATALSLSLSAAATLHLARRTPDEAKTLKIDMGYVVHGLLLHRKFENDLPRAYAAVRRLGDGKHRFKAFQGIGWGLEFRYEQDAELGRVRRTLETLAFEEQVALLSGLRWTAGLRLEELARRVALGDTRPRQRGLLVRIEQLRALADRSWSRLPPQYLFMDEVPPR